MTLVPFRLRIALLAAAAALLLSPLAASAQEKGADPFANPGGAPQWAAGGGAGPEKDGVQPLLPLPRDAELVLPATSSSHVAVGTQVIDLKNSKPAGKFDAELKGSLQDLALSPDGKLFAQEFSDNNVFVIRVFDTQAGRLLHTLQYTEDRFKRVEFLQFTEHNYLVAAVGADGGSRLLAWEMPSGKVVQDLALQRVGAKVGLSPNGRYLAVVQNSQLHIFDVPTGKSLVQLQSPPYEKPLAMFIFLRCLAFSPDGTELAGLLAVDGFRLVVWNQQGQIVEDQRLGLQIGGAYNDGPAIVWAPDGRGLLLHGNYYFDRGLQAVAWMMIPPVQHNYPRRWLDDRHLLASQGTFQDRQLVSVEVPRQAINSAVKSLRSGAEALLKPGDGVRLKIGVGQTRFAQVNQVQQALQQAVSKRLQAGGLTVDDSAPVELQIDYAELQGDQLRVVEGRGPNRQDTGQRVQETLSVLEAKMVRNGAAKPIWEKSIRRGNPHFVRSATVNDQKVRDATFRGIEYLLNSMSIPYFVPADPQATGLPIIKVLPGAAPR